MQIKPRQHTDGLVAMYPAYLAAIRRVNLAEIIYKAQSEITAGEMSVHVEEAIFRAALSAEQGNQKPAQSGPILVIQSHGSFSIFVLAQTIPTK